jgi:protein arginine N-methyltransferase 1
MTDWYPDWFYEIMERDAVRNAAYEAAIRAIVPGRTVLEIGTGPHAFLAVMCARAGAAGIVAIEANRRAFELATGHVAALGLRQIELRHGFSDQVALSGRPAVLVHELLGSIGSAEGAALFVDDAKRRLLEPGALHVPESVSTWIFPTEEPRLTIPERTLGFVLRRGRGLSGAAFVRAYGFPVEAALAEPQEVERIVFGQDYPLQYRRRLQFETSRAGRLAGFACFIRVAVGAGRVVDSLAQRTNWSVPYLRLYRPPVPVQRGAAIALEWQADLSTTSPAYRLDHRHGAAPGRLGPVETFSWSGA